MKLCVLIMDLALAATAAQAYYGSMCPLSMFNTHPYVVVGLGAYYTAPNGGSNPGVYYYPAQQPAPQQDGMNQQQPVNESKKRAFDGVDQFFEDAKRHKIQPVYDGQMAQRLSALQQFVPTTSSEGVDFNGHHATTVTAPAAGQNQYTLPSLRTKQDLIDADHFLTQLSANVYESPAAAAAAGVPVAGGHFAQPYRSNQPSSPHNAQNGVQQQSPNHTPSGHDNAPATTAIMQSSTSTSSGGTSALTPPTSNYTTSHSPNHQHSTPPSQSPQSAGSMYPSLPSIPTSSEGYPAPVSTAPPSSLGPTFDSDSRRRISVGVLQKARPAEQEDVDMDREDNTDKKSEVSDSLIDPELSGALSGEVSVPVIPDDPAREWEKNVELLTNLREYVKSLLEKEEKRDSVDGEDSVMADQDGGVGTNVETGQDGADGNGQSAKEQEEQSDAQALYPVLRAVAVA